MGPKYDQSQNIARAVANHLFLGSVFFWVPHSRFLIYTYFNPAHKLLWVNFRHLACFYP